MLILGFDPGNSETTLAWRSGTAVRHMTVPSFIGSGALEGLRRVRSAAGDGALERDELVLTHGGGSFFVGRLAIEESRDASAARNDVNRYWNGHTLRLVLALAGYAGLSGTARVMTGLPVSAWTPENKRLVQQSLIGTHSYKLNGKDRTLTIDAVGVMMEGAAALAASEVADAPRAVIDIGGRTTDLFWAKGVRPIASRCSATDVGVEKVGDILRRQTLEAHRRDLYDHELRDVLRSALAQTPHQPLYGNGKALDLNSAATDAMRIVGQQIVSYIGQQWGDDRGAVASDAAKVLLIGGGAHYFADQVRAAIPHVEVARAPELANAYGYLAVGLSASEEAWARNRG
jgi:hypothetical protein